MRALPSHSRLFSEEKSAKDFVASNACKQAFDEFKIVKDVAPSEGVAQSLRFGGASPFINACLSNQTIRRCTCVRWHHVQSGHPYRQVNLRE